LSIDLNTEDNDGITGFHHACESGDSDLVKIFMQNAADLNIDLN
jgi:ankyrin repeat protein